MVPRSQVNLSVDSGRVAIPDVLQGGFLAPVLAWLADQREQEQTSNEKHQIFDNVETYHGLWIYRRFCLSPLFQQLLDDQTWIKGCIQQLPTPVNCLLRTLPFLVVFWLHWHLSGVNVFERWLFLLQSNVQLCWLSSGCPSCSQWMTKLFCPWLQTVTRGERSIPWVFTWSCLELPRGSIKISKLVWTQLASGSGQAACWRTVIDQDELVSKQGCFSTSQ